MSKLQLDTNSEKWREQVIKQITCIRDSGITNMFEIQTVNELAKVFRFDELAELLNKNVDGYSIFIMSGDRNNIVIP